MPTSCSAGHRLRVWRKLLWVVGVLAVFGGTLPVLYVGQTQDVLSTDLIRDVQRLSPPHMRPVHRDPVGGSFQTCALQLMSKAPSMGVFDVTAPKDARTQVDDLLSCKTSSMPPGVARDLARVLPWSDAFVACARRDQTGGEEGIGVFSDWSEPSHEAFTALSRAVVKVELLQGWKQVRGKDTSAALARCGDVLAFSRDLAWNRGLLGAFFIVSDSQVAAPVCMAALKSASPPARQRFARELSNIRAGMPTLGQVLDIESAQMQVAVFGKDIAVERLPPGARGLATHGTSSVRHWYDRFGWQSYASQMKELKLTADKSNRDAQFKDIELRYQLTNNLLGDSSQTDQWLRSAHRYDEASVNLQRLEAMARM